MSKNIIILSLFAFLLMPAAVHAEFNDIGFGARPLGMGSAFVALADDANSIYYNPAGLGGIGQKMFTAGYNKLYPGLYDNSRLGNSFAGYVYPFEEKGTLGSIGIGMMSMALSQLYSESIVFISYGRNVSGIVPAQFTIQELADVYFGFSVKLLSKKYDTDYISNSDNLIDNTDTVFAGGLSKSGVTADIGLLYRYNYNLSAGLVIINMLTANMNMGMEEKNSLSRGIKLGGLYRAPFINVTLDLILANSRFDLRAGLEKWLMKGKFALRAGLGINLSFGASYRFRENMRLDYNFNNPLSGINSSGSHVISLNTVFGGKTEKSMQIQEVEEKQIKAAEMLRQTMLNEEQSRIETSIKYYNEALKFAENGEFIEAQQKINSALTINTENMDIQNLFKKLNVVAEVLPVSAGNDDKSILIRKGVGSYIKDDAKQVINIFQYLNEKYPKDKRVHDFSKIINKQYSAIASQEKISAGMNLIDQKLYRALNYLYDNKYDMAVNECKVVLDVEPDNVTALTRMGSAYYILGQESKALELWARALKLNPDNEELSNFIQEKGINIEALRQKEAEKANIEKTFNDSMSYYFKEEKELTLEQKEKTLQRILDKYGASGIDISGAAAEMDKIREAKTGEKTKPVKTNQKEPAKVHTATGQVSPALKKEFTEEEKLALKKQYYGAGTAYYQKGDYSKAVLEFEKILKIDPNHQQSKRLLEQCRQKLGK